MSADPTQDLAAFIAHAEAVEAPIREAVAEVLRMHKRAGNPIADWEDDHVRWIPPAEIQVPDTPGGTCDDGNAAATDPPEDA